MKIHSIMTTQSIGYLALVNGNRQPACPNPSQPAKPDTPSQLVEGAPAAVIITSNSVLFTPATLLNKLKNFNTFSSNYSTRDIR